MELQELIKRHRKELVLATVLIVLSVSMLFWLAGEQDLSRTQKVLEKIGLGFFIAAIVRVTAIAFSASETPVGDFRTTQGAYYKAITKAQNSIWVSETWLPGFATDAKRICDIRKRKKTAEVQVVLASFKPKSFIFARIIKRKGVDVPTAKKNVAQCAAYFAEGEVRFAFGHHPGWITVIDEHTVFWGPTPIDEDNQIAEEPACWNKDSINGERGRFWNAQFGLLWGDKECSHDYETERTHNKAL